MPPPLADGPTRTRGGGERGAPGRTADDGDKLWDTEGEEDMLRCVAVHRQSRYPQMAGGRRPVGIIVSVVLLHRGSGWGRGHPTREGGLGGQMNTHRHRGDGRRGWSSSSAAFMCPRKATAA